MVLKLYLTGGYSVYSETKRKKKHSTIQNNVSLDKLIHSVAYLLQSELLSINLSVSDFY